MSESQFSDAPVLGIEGGGTRTSVLLVGGGGQVLDKFEAGPANLRLMSPGELKAHLGEIAATLPGAPAAVGIGLAGARRESDFDRIRAAAASVWGGVPCAASDDLMTALEASDWREGCRVQTLVLSGTGSCHVSRDRDGKVSKVGGRGHIIGDRASACQIARHALRSVVTVNDIDEKVPPLGGAILAHLQFNDLEDLVEWSAGASKTELADLAIPVFRAAAEGDEIAAAVVAKAAERLAKDATTCSAHLAGAEEQVQFVFNGGVLLRNPEFADDVAARIGGLRPGSVVERLARPSVWGAVEMARRLVAGGAPPGGPAPAQERPKPWRPVSAAPTEGRNPASMKLDEMPVAEAIEMILGQDLTVPPAVLAESEAIGWTVDKVVEAFRAGGHLIYAGAGTSGRLGVLDASECPPTFRAGPEMVQGIIAGGKRALWSAVEGAEDDPRAGAAAIAGRAVTGDDVVVGITASGHAPFVWGALEEAGRRGASSVLLCCNPGFKDHPLPDCVIAVDSGPEVLTGSTRMKAGTATKLALNLISTLAMVGIGKVMGNLMVDLNPSNVKLRDRAARIVAELSGACVDEARSALEANGWDVRRAVGSLGTTP